MRRVSIWMFAAPAAFGLSAAGAAAGVVRGRVELSADTQAAERVSQEIVVYVDSLPPELLNGWSRRPTKLRIIQERRGFTPRVVAVNSGSTVQFINRDRVYHNVFSVSPAKRFDLGKYPPRATNQVSFDEPGVVNLFCDIHPGEAAWVLTLGHRFFARPDRTGAFSLPWLRPGPYTLRAWHPIHGEIARSIEVPARGDLQVALKF